MFEHRAYAEVDAPAPRGVLEHAAQAGVWALCIRGGLCVCTARLAKARCAGWCLGTVNTRSWCLCTVHTRRLVFRDRAHTELGAPDGQRFRFRRVLQQYPHARAASTSARRFKLCCGMRVSQRSCTRGKHRRANIETLLMTRVYCNSPARALGPGSRVWARGLCCGPGRTRRRRQHEVVVRVKHSCTWISTAC